MKVVQNGLREINRNGTAEMAEKYEKLLKNKNM